MKPQYKWEVNSVLATCPDCDAVTSWDTHGFSNTQMGAALVNRSHVFDGQQYSRILWQAFRCAVCSRGGIGKLHDNGNSQTAVLENFIPAAIEKANLPAGVPADVQSEFREAELVAASGAYRSASAMLRSTLEKALKKNGFDEVDVPVPSGGTRKSRRLIDRIDAAASDQIITEARQQRAHQNIRVLGNDVLHDDWREVLPDEYEGAHKYTQRILEDFYDDRPTVVARLTARGRAFVP
jgi:Arc/MetJ-type ribon-helix-helix transcriptional regulator